VQSTSSSKNPKLKNSKSPSKLKIKKGKREQSFFVFQFSILICLEFWKFGVFAI
jgi:hypothetical protein